MAKLKSKNTLTVLAIETSCDETAVAVIRGSGGLARPRFEICSSIVSSQIELHAKWGGVVPNLAKREHIKNLPVVCAEALKKANIKNPAQGIDALAVTTGPGLEPALWTGITFTQELSKKWQLPVVATNHMEGHIFASLLTKKAVIIHFPLLALLVSGGHTQLVHAKRLGDYTVIGETVDDAAGEAFDKVARMMNLGYPGGPVLSKVAKKGNRDAFPFPRPMIHSKNYDFSFSGLKTAVLYTLRDLAKQRVAIPKEDIAASFETAVAESLISKTIRAAKEYRARSIILGGGVAANDFLRSELKKAIRKNIPASTLHLPEKKMTTDNAAMIGAAAYFHAIKKDFTSWKKLNAHATLSL